MTSIWDDVMASAQQISPQASGSIWDNVIASAGVQRPQSQAPSIWDDVMKAADVQPQAPQTQAPASAYTDNIWADVMASAGQPAATPAPSSGGDGVTSHILDLLGYLDRPRNAIATGFKHIGDETGFLGGLNRGIREKEQTSWGDLFGIPATTPEDSWSAYIAKGGARFGLDALLDPLNLVAALGLGGKAASLATKGARAAGFGAQVDKAAQLANRANEALAGTTFGKMFYHNAPDKQYQLLMEKIAREGGETMQELGDRVGSINNLLIEKGINIENPAEMKNLREMLERPSGVGSTLDPEIKLAYDDFKELSAAKLAEYNKYAEKLGFDTKELIQEDELYNWLPRVLSGKGKLESAPWLPGQGAKHSGPIPSAINIDSSQQKSRVLQRWVDRDALHEAGELVNPGEGVLITEMTPESMKRARIHDIPGVGPAYKTSADGPWIPVTAVQASQADLAAVGIDKFVTDPTIALTANVAKKQGQINFMKMLDESLNSGADWIQAKSFVNGKAEIPKGYREVKIPGLENHVAKKWVANQLENMHNLLMDPKSTMGLLEGFFKAFNDSKMGQLLNLQTQNWKRNQLALFPGWHFGNAISNQVLTYLAGVRDPRLIKEAGKIQYDGIKGLANKPSILNGYTTKQLYDEFAKRNLVESGWAGTEGTGTVAGQVGEAGKFKLMEAAGEKAKSLGVPDKVAEAPGKVAEKWRQANEWGFKWGGRIEDNSKVTVALDYIKKATKQGRTIDDQLFDEAALHAKNYLFDYGQLTAFEKQLKSFVPFYSWFRNIIGRTGKDILTAPNDLARIGRFADLTLRPLSQQDKDLAPPWMLSPAYGPNLYMKLMGFQPGENITEVGRFIPQGSVQEFVERPFTYPMAQTAPWLRALMEGTWGQSYQDSRPIDDQAGSLLKGLINPLIGGAYEYGNKKWFGADVPRAVDYAMRSYSPLARYSNTLNTLGADTLWDEPANKVKMGAGGKGNWFITGGKVYPFEREKYQSQKLKDWRKEIESTRTDLRSAAMRGDEKRIQHFVEIYKDRMQKNPLARRGEN